MIKILLVTGDTGIVALWKKALAQHGYTLDVALSAEEALDRAQGGTPDLILTAAIETPQKVFLEQLKRSPSTASIPVVALPASEVRQPETVIPRLKNLLTSRRVLVAEDDRQMAQILRTVLETAGYEVQTAFDGAEALRITKSWHPHLMVLDIMLPVVDGFHVCQTINEDHSIDPRPKILIISGRGSEWDQNLGAACGAEDYLVKPVNHIAFLQKVHEIMAR